MSNHSEETILHEVELEDDPTLTSRPHPGKPAKTRHADEEETTRIAPSAALPDAAYLATEASLPWFETDGDVAYGPTGTEVIRIANPDAVFAATAATQPSLCKWSEVDREKTLTRAPSRSVTRTAADTRAATPPESRNGPCAARTRSLGFALRSIPVHRRPLLGVFAILCAAGVCTASRERLRKALPAPPSTATARSFDANDGGAPNPALSTPERPSRTAALAPENTAASPTGKRTSLGPEITVASNHLIAGRLADAAREYSTIATRSDDDPAIRELATLLRRATKAECARSANAPPGCPEIKR